MATRGLCPIRRYRTNSIYHVGYQSDSLTVVNSDPHICICLFYRLLQNLDHREVRAYLVHMNDYQSLIYNGNVNRASLDLKVPGVRGIEPATNGKPVTLTPSGTDQPNGTAVFDTKKLHAVGMVILALVILDMTANSFVDELVILDSKVTQDEADGFDIRELTEIPPLATLSDATWVKAGDSISISFYLELKCGQGSYYVSLNLSDTDGNPLDFLVDATLGQLVGESKTKHSVATKLFKKRNNTTLTATLGFFTSDGVLIKG